MLSNLEVFYSVDTNYTTFLLHFEFFNPQVLNQVITVLTTLKFCKASSVICLQKFVVL